jgi:hypothetical protein
MPFNRFRAASSPLNTLFPNAGLSSPIAFPCSSRRARSSPNAARICLKARVPGSTAFLARTSASIIARECLSLRREDTVDLPVAIPPVNPTTSIADNEETCRAEDEWISGSGARPTWLVFVFHSLSGVAPPNEKTDQGEMQEQQRISFVERK